LQSWEVHKQSIFCCQMSTDGWSSTSSAIACFVWIYRK